MEFASATFTHWGVRAMLGFGDRLSRLVPALAPAAIVTLGCTVGLLPWHAVGRTIGLLAVWMMLSLPLGIVIGHCALSEPDSP
jgi:hypothetical protein